MKAAVLEKIKEPLVIYTDYPDPTPGDNEVIVQIKAAALNRRDLWIQQGQYARIKTPCILGSDGSGIVVDVGNNDRHWALSMITCSSRQSCSGSPIG